MGALQLRGFHGKGSHNSGSYAAKEHVRCRMSVLGGNSGGQTRIAEIKGDVIGGSHREIS
jgi:hypothetical protein